jgi:hypothetical protein
MLLHELTMAEPISAVRFNDGGNLLSVVSDVGTVTWLDSSRNFKPSGVFKTDIFECDLVYHPNGDNLMVLGHLNEQRHDRVWLLRN